jgi:hypothetical protein
MDKMEPAVIERVITGIVVGTIMLFGLGLNLWVIKRWLIRIETAVGILDEKRQECQKELPTRYAEKESLNDLWKRFDDHETRISRSEGIRSGVKV